MSGLHGAFEFVCLPAVVGLSEVDYLLPGTQTTKTLRRSLWPQVINLDQSDDGWQTHKISKAS